MRSKIANNAFLTFDLMIKVAPTKKFMRLKVLKALLATFDLMNIFVEIVSPVIPKI
jgi:hypothetical protein